MLVPAPVEAEQHAQGEGQQQEEGEESCRHVDDLKLRDAGRRVTVRGHLAEGLDEGEEVRIGSEELPFFGFHCGRTCDRMVSDGKLA